MRNQLLIADAVSAVTFSRAVVRRGGDERSVIDTEFVQYLFQFLGDQAVMRPRAGNDGSVVRPFPAILDLDFVALSESRLLLSDYYKKEEGYRTVRQQGASSWLVTYTLSGQGAFRIGEQAYRCGEGDVMILSPGTPHDYMTLPGHVWEFHWAHVLPPKYWVSAMRIPADRQIHIANPYIQGRIDHSFRDLHRDQYFESSYRNLLCLNALGTILVFIASADEENRDGQKTDLRVETVISYLSEHLSEPLKLSVLAESVNLSVSRLSHLFKEHTGYSIIEMLLKIRLQRAANLLQYSGDSVEQIGESVGFSSIHYFSSAFKKRFGVSPSLYRKEMK